MSQLLRVLRKGGIGNNAGKAGLVMSFSRKDLLNSTYTHGIARIVLGLHSNLTVAFKSADNQINSIIRATWS